MKIVQLNISNFKKIAVAEIRPDGHKVILGGDNGAGKTSVLDAIMVALVGPRAMPAVPVRQGAEGAEIRVDCGDVVVTRKIKPDGTGTLAVKTADGMRPTSPQKWLDERIGAIAFDPLSFTRLDAKAQANTLRTLVGVDVSDLDSELAAVYDERTAVNRELKQAEALASTMPRHEGVPEDEVSIAGLVAEMQAASAEEIRRSQLASLIPREEDRVASKGRERAACIKGFDAWLEQQDRWQQASVQRHVAELATLDENEAELDSLIANEQADEAEELDDEIAELKARLAKLEEDRATLEARYVVKRQTRAAWLTERRELVAQAIAEANAEHAARVASKRTSLDADLEAIARDEAQAQETIAQIKTTLAQPHGPTTAELQTKLRDAEATNTKVRENRAASAAKANADALRAESEAKTARIAELDAARKARIASAKWPVEGLGFDEAGTVTFRGVPLAQASQAEQIRVSMAIGLALNPSLRVVLVRDASLLDEKSLALVSEMAAQADAQVWLERVSKADAGAIVMEDGHVVEVVA